MARPRRLDAAEVSRQLDELPGWTGDVDRLARAYAFPEFMAVIRAVDAVAVEAEDMDHHPDLDIRWRTLHIVISTHDVGGTTQLDVELAHRIHGIATGLGAT